jgi:triacylglycerol lipase
MPLTPIWRESLLGVELAGLLRAAIFREAPEAPSPRPVLLIPGFLTGDAQMGTLASWLRRCGHRTHTSGIRLNVDCAESSMARLEERLEAFVKQEGEPAVLIGQSRGGTFARVLAVRRPELVSSIVTLGSPHLDPLAVHPLVWVQGATLAALSALGLPGVASHRCRSGPCCEPFWRDLSAPLGDDVEFVSIYSDRDGIVDWQACLDPGAVNMKVSSTHCGMGVNAAVYELLDRVLHPRPARKQARRRAPQARAAAA